jgi:galactokinase
VRSPTAPGPATTKAERSARVEALLLADHDNGLPPIKVAAPGRVNLIGEHLDYNEGFVFPAAIDRAFVGAFQQRKDDKIVLRSLNQGEPVEIDLSKLEAKSGELWGDYVRGVALALRDHGVELKGVHGVIESDIPMGSGLSSSAALELLVAKAMITAAGAQKPNDELAKICQIAESKYVGVKCGIMDQFAIAMGKQGCALLLDTRSLEFEAIRMDLRGHKIVIGNTRKKRSLVDSAFNQRLAECAGALDEIRALTGRDLKALRDVDLETFAHVRERMTPVLRKRAEHVITEIERVLQAVEALKLGRPGSIEQFGELMNQSHLSLRDQYEVSCKELDTMVELAQSQRGVLGARMTGAGFGGCTVAIVRDDAVEDFIGAIGEPYTKATGLVPEFYVSTLEDGVSLLS